MKFYKKHEPENPEFSSCFVPLIWHPATRGRSYTIRHGRTGTPYQAYLSNGYDWFKIEVVRPDGTFRLGAKLTKILDIEYIRQSTNLTR